VDSAAREMPRVPLIEARDVTSKRHAPYPPAARIVTSGSRSTRFVLKWSTQPQKPPPSPPPFAFFTSASIQAWYCSGVSIVT
jgi:hypothetical protein